MDASPEPMAVGTFTEVTLPVVPLLLLLLCSLFLFFMKTEGGNVDSFSLSSAETFSIVGGEEMGSSL